MRQFIIAKRSKDIDYVSKPMPYNVAHSRMWTWLGSARDECAAWVSYDAETWGNDDMALRAMKGLIEDYNYSISVLENCGEYTDNETFFAHICGMVYYISVA